MADKSHSVPPDSEIVPLRRVNFTQSERMRLISLVEKHKTSLIGAQHDSVMVNARKKTAAWLEIMKEFNACNADGNFRDARQLRKCWENMKTRFKRVNRSNGTEATPTQIASGQQTAITLANSEPRNQNVAEMFMSSRNEADSASNTPLSLDSFRQTYVQPIIDSQPPHPPAKVEDPLPGPAPVFVHGDESDGGASPNESGFSDSLQINSVVSMSTRASGPGPSAQTLPFQSLVSGRGPSLVPETKKGRLNGGGLMNKGASAQGPLAMGGQQRLSWHAGRKRPSAIVDPEKALRMRLLRARIREHEVRTRALQQNMRHSVERHEATLMLLRRKTAHCEALVERMRTAEEREDDSVLEEEEMAMVGDLMWDTL